MAVNSRIFEGDLENVDSESSLSQSQHSALLKWISMGYTYAEIIERAVNFNPPFKPDEKLISNYRVKYRSQIVETRREFEQEAIEVGLALRRNRLQALHSLAHLLEDDIHRKGKLWIQHVKGLGSGNYYERVIEEEFNEAELRQLRGVYEDIA